MGGAAVVLSAFHAYASSSPSRKLVACIPLTENMIGQGSTRPGDVYEAMNGKTVEIDNTGTYTH
jgi:leucyl aminopeptidase